MLTISRTRIRMLACALAVAAAFPAGAALLKSGEQAATPMRVGEEISTLIHRLDGQVFDANRRELAELQELYDRRWDAALWTDATGVPSRDALDGLAELRGSSLDGLEPEDYGWAVLETHARLVESAPTPAGIAAFDVRLSLAMLRYFRHLHLGRVDPRELGIRIDVPPDEHDFVETLRTALATHRFAQVVEGLRPALTQYRGLREGLARHRDMAAVWPEDEDIARQVRQIELALERLRWLPDFGDDRLVEVNIPTFGLRAWELALGQTPSLAMPVIVGRAMRQQTPIFVSEIRQVVFRPYWNVPPSIVRAEILPAVSRTPGYLAKHNMEIVRGAGDDAVPVPPSNENLTLLRAGTLRLRQRPGPANALGLIKFVLPNNENIYMHDTPNAALFNRTRRDFSHGCIRLGDPEALAEWLLDDPGQWSRDQIRIATGGPTRSVALARPVPVIIFYTTASFVPENGTVQFTDDIYGHDARLDRALRPAGEE